MRTICAGAVALMCSMHGAAAKDLTAAQNWGGGFAGVHAGYGTAGGDAASRALDAFTEAFVVSGQIPSPIDLDGGNPLGGVHAGYGWQRGQFLFGLESDVTWLGQDADSFAVYDNSERSEMTVEQDIDWLVTARLKAGAAVSEKIAIYATGGAALGRSETSVHLRMTSPVFNTDGYTEGDGSDVKAGWVIGGGAEWAFAQHWTLRGEILHYDLGDSTVEADTTGGPDPLTNIHFESRFDNSGTLGRLGVSYRF